MWCSYANQLRTKFAASLQLRSSKEMKISSKSSSTYIARALATYMLQLCTVYIFAVPLSFHQFSNCNFLEYIVFSIDVFSYAAKICFLISSISRNISLNISSKKYADFAVPLSFHQNCKLCFSRKVFSLDIFSYVCDIFQYFKEYQF